MNARWIVYIVLGIMLTSSHISHLAVRMIGGADEHLAFLIFRALELQGEVQKAFGHAVVYEALDPEVSGLLCFHPVKPIVCVEMVFIDRFCP